jgi:hypothetical protein
MTDQPPPPAPNPGSDSPEGWSPPPPAEQPTAASTPPSVEPSVAPPMAPSMAPPAAPPVPAAKPQSKVRTYIIGAVVIALIAFGAYAISQNQSAGDLAVGQCFDEPGRDTDITTVVKHACTEAHDAEVFMVVEYNKGDSYPISLSLDSFIDDTCVPEFENYVGEPYDVDTPYDLAYFYPDEDAWTSGKKDRTFTCYIVRTDGTKLTQSVKAAGPAAS